MKMSAVILLAAALLIGGIWLYASSEEEAGENQADVVDQKPVSRKSGSVADSKPKENSDPENSDVSDVDATDRDVAASAPNSLDNYPVYENIIVAGSSLDQGNILELATSGEFRSFIAELRDSGDTAAQAKRSKFESLLFSETAVLSGQVSISSLECGRIVCAAEITSVGTETVDGFLVGFLSNDQVEIGSLVQIPNPDNDDENSMIVVFSHDPSINSVVFNP